MAGKEVTHQSFSLGASPRGCLLKTGAVASAGDGLILSSFQVLEHREDGGKAAHDLDHFLHPYGHDDRLSGHDGQWKTTTDLQPIDCHTDPSHQTHSLPDMRSLNSSDHTGSSFLNDFRSDEMAGAQGHQAAKLMPVGGNGRTDGNDDDDDEDEDEDDDEDEEDVDGGEGGDHVESFNSSMARTLHRLGDKMHDHEHKADGFDDLEVETPDLLTSHKQGFIEMEPGLADHGFMNSSGARGAWPQDVPVDLGHTRNDASVSGWPTEEKRDTGDDVTHLEAPEAGKGWEFLHADQQHSTQNMQLHHQWMSSGDNKMAETDMTSQHCQEGWGPGAKMMSTPSNEPWDKPQTDAEDHHSLMSTETVVSATTHWTKQTRPVSADGIPWMQGVGGVYPVANQDVSVCKMFQVAHTSSDNAPPSTCPPQNSCIAQWPMDGQVTSARPNAFPSRPGPIRDTGMTSCRRVAAPSCLRAMASHVHHRYQTPPGTQPDGWPQQGHTPPPMHPASPLARCVEPVSDVQPGPLCPNPATMGKRAKAVVSRRSGVTVTSTMAPAGDVPKARPLLDQARKQSHPYLMKDAKKGVRDMFPGTGANVHTLKASHIVSWYIDYLIHENEHLTQISRAFSLPVNLFHSDDFYFMESVKKKVHFPSLKFLSWMQQNLPSINVNAVDFHEGRPPVVSVWNQDWFWQNKSRRDIIHDVFFYFQHRRVTCPI